MTRNKLHGRTSNGNLQNGPQSAEPRLAQGDVATMNAGDVAGWTTSSSGWGTSRSIRHTRIDAAPKSTAATAVGIGAVYRPVANVVEPRSSTIALR